MKKLGIILYIVGSLIDLISTLFKNNIGVFIHRTAYNIFFGFLFIYLCVAHYRKHKDL
ncbi:hypothetical protein AB2063_003017 [Clostridium botulinum]